MDCENNIHLRVASFSSYLRKGEENTTDKLAESRQSSSITFCSTLETPCPINLVRSKTAEGEINVFGAEKYFNEIMDDETPRFTEKTAQRNGHKLVDQADLQHPKPIVKLATPSLSSEASSNSQTALLPSLLRNSSQSKQKKVHERRFFSGFGCKGSCVDKKSVYIEENVQHGVIHAKEIRKEASQVDLNPVMLDGIKQSQPGGQIKEEIQSQSFRKARIGLNREEYFAFPALSSVPENRTVTKQLEDTKAEEEARKSLEVFGSHLMKKGDIVTNLERKLSVLTWDAIPKVPNLSSTSRSVGTYEENESDASSDLFEIENLSGNVLPYFMRQDSTSSCMTPTRYEPSEASIEWSVVTASAADFSAISDYEENKPSEVGAEPQEVIFAFSTGKPVKTKSIVSKEAQSSPPGGLLGCRSHKAVRVAETAYKPNEKANSVHPRRDSSFQMGKSQAENKVKNIEFPWPQHAFASTDLSPSRPARATQSPYMQ